MENQFPTLSVIIPCYNSGEFLPECIESVQANCAISYEIILVDDGTYDPSSLMQLEKFKSQGLRVINQTNKGPAAARNNGVKYSNGIYLLFLDSDNKIKTGYADQSIAIMESNPEIDVVYGKPNFFGDKLVKPRFVTGKFDFDKVLIGNYIDMCAFIRKKAFLDVGGFDEDEALIGYEDGDLWIRLAIAKHQFKFIDDILFDYRVRHDSLTAYADAQRLAKKKYLVNKHATVIFDRFSHFYSLYSYSVKHPFKVMIKNIMQKILKIFKNSEIKA